MLTGEIILRWVDWCVHETILFAAVGFLIGGIDELAVDLIYLIGRLRRGRGSLRLADLPPPRTRGTLAVFVPAWDESRVIGQMLRSALARFDHGDYRIFVGVYPNDPATIAVVGAVAATDPRIRMVQTPRPGPTTKADCLNALWREMRREQAGGRCFKAVVLHDSEDVVDRGELRVYDSLLDVHAIVQIPVEPLIDRRARMVSGHYADEFADGHGRQLVVRAMIGAGMPLAGVGCAIDVALLATIEQRHGAPFDETCITEDYELGLGVSALGLRVRFARVRDESGRLIAVRAYFPARLGAAVVQKSRWMTGIALAGWDRIGWGRIADVAEHWMRMRDRRPPIAVLVIAAAYLSALGWACSQLAHSLLRMPGPPDDPGLDLLLMVNLGLLLWRLLVRFAVTAHPYGWREGLWSLPRLLVANIITLLAARRALARYIASRAGDTLRWDKTTHDFPDDLFEPTRS